MTSRRVLGRNNTSRIKLQKVFNFNNLQDDDSDTSHDHVDTTSRCQNVNDRSRTTHNHTAIVSGDAPVQISAADTAAAVQSTSRTNSKNNLTAPDVIPADGSSMESSFGESQGSGHVTSDKRRLRRANKRRNEELRLTISFFVSIILFIICWFPFCISMFFSTFTNVKLPLTLDIVTLILGCFNSTLNPLVYGLLNRRFNDAFRRLFRCRVRK